MKRFAAWVTEFRKRINRSLTAKTFLSLLALFIIVLLAVYSFAGLFLPFTNEGQARSDLVKRSEILIAELRKISAGESGELFIDFLQETGADLALLDEDRKPVTWFAYGKRLKEPNAGGNLSGEPYGLSAGGDGGRPENYGAGGESAGPREYPFRFAGSSDEYILAVAYNPVVSNEIKAAIIRSLPWVGLVILVLSTGAAFFFSRYAAAPIMRISKTAAHIARLDFSWYCPDVRDDEIGTLARSVNELSDRLNAALTSLNLYNSSLENDIARERERERRRLLFFSAVSHELKTPVVTVIGQLEGIRAGIGVYKDKEKYLARAAEILRGLDGFIKEILSVAYMDMSEIRAGGAVNLSAVTDTAAAGSAALFEARDVCLTMDIEPDIYARGVPELLEKAIGNAAANAALYAPVQRSPEKSAPEKNAPEKNASEKNAPEKNASAESSAGRAAGIENSPPHAADVIISLSRQRGKAVLQVINLNSHIAEEHLPHLFEAFYRAGNQGGGTGLGLYITGMILESHGAAFKIENRGGGVVFEAEFSDIKKPE